MGAPLPLRIAGPAQHESHVCECELVVRTGRTQDCARSTGLYSVASKALYCVSSALPMSAMCASVAGRQTLQRHMQTETLSELSRAPWHR